VDITVARIVPLLPAQWPPDDTRRVGLPLELLLASTLVAGVVLRLWLAFHDDGLYWPDEVFQSLEPAHRVVFHYGLIPWEFIDGARNWLFPGLIAGVMKLGTLVGLGAPRGYLGLVRVVMCGVGVATGYGVYFLARRLGAGPLAAVAGAGLWLLSPVAVYFAPRALSETASALPIVLGLGLAAPVGATRRERVLGASLLGLAVLLRLQVAVFPAGLLALELGRRRWRAALETAGMLLLWALAFGLLDKVTWGDFFHSAFAYWKANVVENKSVNWGTAEPGYYLSVLFRSSPIVAAACLTLGALGLLARPGVGLTAVAFFALHSAIPHKELRFILPVLPVVFAEVAVGAEVLGRWRAGVKSALAAGLLITSAWSAARFHELTFHDLGAYEGSSMAAQSAYDMSGPVNRLLMTAGTLPDICGLRIEVSHLAWTGGYSYFHREVPLFGGTNGPPRESGVYNYVVTAPRAAAGAEIVAADGPWVLARLFPGGCAPFPSYSWRLP
jgi:hypothetical protein